MFYLKHNKNPFLFLEYTKTNWCSMRKLQDYSYHALATQQQPGAGV